MRDRRAYLSVALKVCGASYGRVHHGETFRMEARFLDMSMRNISNALMLDEGSSWLSKMMADVHRAFYPQKAFGMEPLHFTPDMDSYLSINEWRPR